MGKIVVAKYLTLDGVSEDPGPAGEFEHSGWSVPYWSDELSEIKSGLLFTSDALLLGDRDERHAQVHCFADLGGTARMER